MELQKKQIEINETRKELARLQFEKGQLRSNRDVVEAENDWRDAVNAYARLDEMTASPEINAVSWAAAAALLVLLVATAGLLITRTSRRFFSRP